MTGEPVIVARHGKPIAALVRVDEAQITDLVLSAAPEFVDSLREADEDLVADRVEPLSAVLSDLAAAESDSGILGELAGATVGGSLYGDVIGRISRDIIESAPIELEAKDAVGLRELNEDLIRAALATELEGAFQSALDRVRTLNANAATGSDADQYKLVLESASTVEHLYRGSTSADPTPAASTIVENVVAFSTAAEHVQGAQPRAAPARRARKRTKPSKA
jgi:antitoxin (DNA-binding transcriptional repressor) of toxin-antitoxin stability system